MCVIYMVLNEGLGNLHPASLIWSPDTPMSYVMLAGYTQVSAPTVKIEGSHEIFVQASVWHALPKSLR